MSAATSVSRLEDRLSGLLDLERSRRFHDGLEALDLRTMDALLAALPELAWPRIGVHVAGSEGKTSTTELIAVGLRAHGLVTATFTSPHLRDVRERLRIDGAFADPAGLDDAVETVEAALHRARITPSYFEYLTAVARVLFARRPVDAVVWETGLGGRLDATRRMRADLCAITTVSLEHTAILGSTLAAIAAEKAGILRAGVPVVVGAGVPDEARRVIESRASDLGCPLDIVAARHDDALGDNRTLALACLARLAARHHLPAPPGDLSALLAAHRVEGRDQRVGRVLFDGAHSVSAVRGLARRLATLDVARIVFGATHGRDVRSMLDTLAPVCEGLVLTQAPGGRGLSVSELRAALPDGVAAVEVGDPERALAVAQEQAGPGRLVVVTGSLHLVGSLLPGPGA
jgi:dihydrofolate synthase/folylpolyglutamate synthase